MLPWGALRTVPSARSTRTWSELEAGKAYPSSERWEEVKALGREIEEMIPVLLSVDLVPEIWASAPDAVHWTARAHEGSVYVFLVNDGRSPVRASVRLPYRSGRVTLGDREVPVGDDDVLTTEIEPLGVQTYGIGR